MPDARCGFIGLIGRPNAGKSTLLNRILGQKLVITTHKPQTTRHRILGIKTVEHCQMIFMDTPGIHQPTALLNEKMVQSAIDALKESDLNLFLIDPLELNQKALNRTDAHILDELKNAGAPCILVINKIDTLHKPKLLHTIDTCQKLYDFLDIIPISALKGDNVDRLLSLIQNSLPQSEFYFESDQITDVSERFIVSELIREAVFKRLQQELPYCSAVEVEAFEEKEKIIDIAATIFVERDSQKGIVIGKKGSQLKEIGSMARPKIERLLGKQVFLSLHVKVLKSWTQRPSHLQQLGFQ